MNNTIEVLEKIKKYYAQDIIQSTETGSKRFKAIDKAIANEKALESAEDELWKEPGKVTWDKDDFTAECEFRGFGKGVDWMKPILAKQILKVEELEEYKKFVEKYRLHQPENPNDERSWLPIVFDRDSKIKELEDTIEQLRVQLAVCGVAALGYAKGKNDCKKGDYGWSVSFEDVKRMRAELEAKIKEIENESPR